MKKILFLTLCMFAFGFGMAQQHHWTPVENFENTMDGECVILIDGVLQNDANLELGVFCGDECRDTRFPEGGVYYITMGGVTGESFTFRLYDHSIPGEPNLVCNDLIAFEINGFIGTSIICCANASYQKSKYCNCCDHFASSTSLFDWNLH